MQTKDDIKPWFNKENASLVLQGLMLVGILLMGFLSTKFTTKEEAKDISAKLDVVMVSQIRMEGIPNAIKDNDVEIKNIDKRVTILETKQGK